MAEQPDVAAPPAPATAQDGAAVSGHLELVPPPAQPRPDGLALVGALVNAIVVKLDGLYSELLAAKDNQIIAKDDLIAELRRQVEQAERELAALERAAIEGQAVPTVEEVGRLRTANEQQAAELRRLRERIDRLEAAGVPPPEDRQEPQAASPAWSSPQTAPVHLPRSDAPTPGARASGPGAHVSGGGVATAAVAPTRAPRISRRLLIAALPIAALIVVIVALSRLLIPAAPRHEVLSARTGAGPASPVTPIISVPLTVRRVLGDAVGLLAPDDAVALRTGYIAVADTGNHRLALLDNAGRLVRSEQGGGLQQPVAVVSASHALYVLDARRGTIDRYSTKGRFAGEVIHAGILRDGAGMAADRHGLLYVTNPALNSVIVLSVTGKVRRRMTGPAGTGRVGFDGPSAIASGPRGTIYVLDTGHDRIVALTRSGAIVAQWPAPPVEGPAHLLPLPDGRLLVSEPSGAVLVYAADSSLPVFQRSLRLPGGHGHVTGPLGLSLTPGGALLVADTGGNRLLIVSLSHGRL